MTTLIKYNPFSSHGISDWTDFGISLISVGSDFFSSGAGVCVGSWLCLVDCFGLSCLLSGWLLVCFTFLDSLALSLNNLSLMDLASWSLIFVVDLSTFASDHLGYCFDFSFSACHYHFSLSALRSSLLKNLASSICWFTSASIWAARDFCFAYHSASAFACCSSSVIFHWVSLICHSFSTSAIFCSIAWRILSFICFTRSSWFTF